MGEEQGTEIQTFLIADVRGYTLFTNERGDEAAAKLAAKFASIARAGVEARGGTVIELRGDEALAGDGAANAGAAWLVPIVAVMVTINVMGGVGGWFAATARLPFVAGLDRRIWAARNDRRASSPDRCFAHWLRCVRRNCETQ